MGSQFIERRLAAILAADMVGYSRLMAADEEGTLERLKTLHTSLVQPEILEHNGRIVKLMGGGNRERTVSPVGDRLHPAPT
ncbi:MAG: hypothetical protein WD715_07990 [Dongiaceae bacterium]